MGKLAEIYDAEMLVLLRGLETAIEFQQETPEVRQKIVKDRISRRRHVLERCDNERGPRTQPTNIDRGNCDDLPRREQKCKHGSIVGPRTHGNIRKRQSGRNSEGGNRTQAGHRNNHHSEAPLATSRQAESRVDERTGERANKPMTGRYAIAGRIPPSLAGSHAFRTLTDTR